VNRRRAFLLSCALRMACVLALAPALACAQTDDSTPLIVEDIECRGNQATSCAFILDHLRLRPGVRLDEQEIASAKLRLATIPSLASVTIYLEKGSARGKARVIVQVTEGDAITKEWLAGLSARDSTLSQVFAGSISNQNLFGRGHILDFQLWGRVPIETPTRRELSARLEYVQPHLFDSRQYLTMGVGRTDALWSSPNGNRFQTRYVSADILTGVRLWDFSYLSVGYIRRADMDVHWRWRIEDGSFASLDRIATNVPFLVYGWNTEDDAYFPTRGSRFQAALRPRTREETIGTFLARRTWQVGSESFLTFRLGHTPRADYGASLDEAADIGFEYARPLHFADALGEARRGRWYITPGMTRHGNLPDGTRTREVSVQAGVRIETRRFGFIHLYVIGSRLNHGDDGK
jgi:outer membrane translocation and assembly module TamA